jgi:uroporphyrin-3 C-methyltransferase
MKSDPAAPAGSHAANAATPETVAPSTLAAGTGAEAEAAPVAPGSADAEAPSAHLPPEPLPPEPLVSPNDKHLKTLLGIVGAVAVAGALGAVMAWQRLGDMQEQLARQSADTANQAAQAHAFAKQAQDLSLDTAAKLSVVQARLAEVSLQRSQLEELMQSLARSRDENLVVDIESALRLAQQQAQLTGSLEPLLAALKSAEGRIARAAQPRLSRLQRAIGRDIARVKSTALADTPALLARLDDLVKQIDDLPLGNAPPAQAAQTPKPRGDEPLSSWWDRLVAVVGEELRALVRVGRIEQPEAALLAPEQAFFLRENLKLLLLNARLGLLSRQIDSARSDLAKAGLLLQRYFDGGSRKTQSAMQGLAQAQGQMQSLEIPRIDETLAALSTAAAGR